MTESENVEVIPSGQYDNAESMENPASRSPASRQGKGNNMSTKDSQKGKVVSER